MIVTLTTVMALALLAVAANWLVGIVFGIRENQTSAEHEHSNGETVGRPADYQTNWEAYFGKWGWWLPLPASLQANYLELLYPRSYVRRTSHYLEDLFDVASTQHYHEYQKYAVS